MPGLREVTRTAPYMHDGSRTTLDDVLHLYMMGRLHSPAMDQRALGIEMTEKDSLAVQEFLKALEGSGWQGFVKPL